MSNNQNNITILMPTYQLKLGEPLNILFYNGHINLKFYSFCSSDTSIATINSIGIITPIKTGYFFFIVINYQNEIVFTSNTIQVIQQSVQSAILPTVLPTVQPTIQSTIEPTLQSTILPTVQPTILPTIEPIVQHIVQPIIQPIIQSVVEAVPQQIDQHILQPKHPQKILSSNNKNTNKAIVKKKYQNRNII